MRKYWLQVRARGRSRFIWERIRTSVLIGMCVSVIIEIRDRAHPTSAKTFAIIALGILPILVLGGYLEGNWRWQELEKEYPE
jgi:hypothetical protein